MAVFLSFGYDTEAPYGDKAATPEGAEIRRQNIETVRALNELFDTEGIPRTHFILGNWLEHCRADHSQEQLQNLFTGSPGLEVGQHSYSHQTIKEVPGQPDRKKVPIDDFARDVARAQSVISGILNVRPRGLRIPIGYASDLSDVPALLPQLVEAGITYVSSDLRGRVVSYNGEISRERQPHTYELAGTDALVEIPSHGWQDTAFMKDKIEKAMGRGSITLDELAAYYEMLFDQGLMLSGAGMGDVHIGLCLHPQAVREYDPTLELHRRKIKAAEERKIKIVTYGTIAERVRNHQL